MPNFDGQNLLITLDSGVTTVNVETDLYSDWKEWVLLGDNSKYPLAFRTIGGDPLTPGINAGAYFFLQNQNGWRIKPPEEDITIFLEGNLAPEDSSKNIFVPTSGAFTAAILGLQPITQSVDQILTSQQKGLKDLQYLLKAERAHHVATGNVYYWDPSAGNDANDGLSPAKAKQTFAAAHDLATSGNHDTIICIPGTVGAPTVSTETIVISKRYLFIRGPGRDFVLSPTDDTKDTITVTADGVEISGLVINTAITGTNNAIRCTAGFLLVNNVYLEMSTLRGIYITGGTGHVLEYNTIEQCGSNGVELEDSVNAVIKHNRIQRNTGSGVSLTGSLTRDVWLDNNVFHHNGPGAINIGTGVNMTIIGEFNQFGPPPGSPGGDDIIDGGTQTHNFFQEKQDRFADAVWDESQADHIDSGSTGELLNSISSINPPTSTQIADAVLAELIADHQSVPGSLAEAVMLIKGLSQNNYILDNTDYNSDGLLIAGRLRIFSTGAQVTAATDGGTGEGELATLNISVEAESADQSKVKIYKVSNS